MSECGSRLGQAEDAISEQCACMSAGKLPLYSDSSGDPLLAWLPEKFICALPSPDYKKLQPTSFLVKWRRWYIEERPRKTGHLIGDIGGKCLLMGETMKTLLSGVWTWDHLSTGEWLTVGVIFCFNSKPCEGHWGIATHFLVTSSGKVIAGYNYICIIYTALPRVEI